MKRTASILVLLSALILISTMAHRSPLPSSDVPPDKDIKSPSTRTTENATADEYHSPITERERLAASLLSGAEAESDPEHRSELLSRTAESVAEGDFAKVLSVLVSLDTPAACELRQLVVRRWTEGSPEAAAAWAAHLPDSPVAAEALTQVSIAWADINLAAAIAWSGSLKESAAKSSALVGLAYEAAREEPLTAMEVAVKLPASPERDRLLVYTASQWAGVDPATVTQWAGTVPDVTLRQRLLAATSIALASQNGAAAANLAVNFLPAGEDQDRAVVGVVQRWAESSPRSAANWIAQFPDTPLRQVAVQNLVALWTAQDTVGPANWLRELPETSLQKVGWMAYAQAARQQDRPVSSLSSSIPAN